MSNQIVISSGAKVRSLNGVITGTTGVLDSLPINAANGIPQLDVNGKILVSQLPNSVMEYQGTWNANTNTPTLTNGGAFNQGDVYLCNVAGTTDFGAGPIAFVVGDQVIYSGSIWQRASGSTGTVTSVAVTETGDALTITGSPITTSGTINVGFAGTSAQYVAGNGALVTFPDLTGYVTLTTTQTISGTKTFTNSNVFSGANLFTTWSMRFDQGTAIKETANFGSTLGYTTIGGAVNGLALKLSDDGKKTFAFANATTNNTYTFPDATGTVALTSDLTGGTVTSVGLTMPVAFNVASSPITTSGTLAVTAAGFASQYIRGDGTLADFPSSGGGGSSVSYYLNGGTSQGVIGGTTYYEMSKTADTGTGVDFPKTGNGLIVSFLTDANDPAQLTIPSGNWNYEIYVSMSANGGTPQLYAELYKYDGTTFTLISTSTNEILYDGTTLNLYTFAMAVPTTTLTVTDRLAVKLYATNSGGKTTTVHTQNGHLCQIITTFSTGITALNGLTTQVQYFQVGTSGTDFNISSATATHTFNLPTASAANRGALSSADWTTFNNKQSTLSLTTTGNSGSATLVSNTLNVPTYTLAGLGGISLTSLSATTPLSYNNTTGAFSIQVANTSQDGYLSSTDWNTFNGKQNTITNPVTGTGTSGQVTYFNGTSSVTSSSSFKFDGTNLTIGNPSSALAQLHVYNASAAATILLQTNSTTDYSEIAVRNNSSTATSYFRQYSTAATGSDFGISRAGLALFFSNYATNFAIGTRNGGDLILGTNDVERARMFSATGNLTLNSSSDSGYKLDVNGTGRFSDNLTMTIASGTKSIGFGGNTIAAAANALIYSDTNYLVLNSKAGSALYLNFDNVNASSTINMFNGKFILTQAGAATFSSSVTATQLNATTTAAGYAAILTNTNGASDSNGLLVKAGSTSSEYVVRFAPQSDASTFFTVKGNGNVGILTSSPLRNLVVKQSVNSYLGGLAVEQSNNLSYLGIFNDGTLWNIAASYNSGGSYQPIGFFTSDVERMRITSGGNVGIGTSTPGAKLAIAVAASGTNQLVIDASNLSDASFTLSLRTNITELNAGGAGNMTFSNSSERMRITSGGNVLINCQSAPSASVQGFIINGSSSGNASSSGASTAAYNHLLFYNGNGIVGSISTSGLLTSYTTTSDYRLKEDLQQIKGLEVLSAIKVYNYKWKSEDSRMDGVLAHELAEVLPYAVTGEKDAVNEDGTDKMQGVDYSKIVPILIKSIQELEARLKTIENK